MLTSMKVTIYLHVVDVVDVVLVLVVDVVVVVLVVVVDVLVPELEMILCLSQEYKRIP